MVINKKMNFLYKEAVSAYASNISSRNYSPNMPEEVLQILNGTYVSQRLHKQGKRIRGAKTYIFEDGTKQEVLTYKGRMKAVSKLLKLESREEFRSLNDLINQSTYLRKSHRIFGVKRVLVELRNEQGNHKSIETKLEIPKVRTFDFSPYIASGNLPKVDTLDLNQLNSQPCVNYLRPIEFKKTIWDKIALWTAGVAASFLFAGTLYFSSFSSKQDSPVISNISGRLESLIEERNYLKSNSDISPGSLADFSLQPVPR